MFSFFKRCKHEYTPWEITHRWVNNNNGVVKIAQQRFCKICGYTQIDVQEKGW